MSSEAKTIAIFGAGVAGIVTARHALEAGFQPTVFEKTSHIGGIWSPKGLSWEDMHTNVGSHTVSFSDFPWPEGSLIFPNSRDVYKYLIDYINKFNIQDRFRLNTRVDSVRLLEDKRWKIKSVCDGKETVEVFDYCIVSTGFNSQAQLTEEYERGKEVFKGLIIHSAEYQSRDERLKGKNVIVVGSSYSAVDLVCALTSHAKSVTNLFKRPYIVLPKIVRDQTEDGFVRLSSIDCATYSRRCFYNTDPSHPYHVMNIFARLSPYQTDPSKCDPDLLIDLKTTKREFIKTSLTDDYLNAVRNSSIKLKRGQISSFRENGVVTNDGTFIQADAVIFCTSYKMNLSFFDEETLRILNYEPKYMNDPISLYKNTWHPDLPNMAFIGMFQGIVCIVGELQAKWIMRVLRGQISLPARSIMKESIAKEDEKRERNVQRQFAYHFIHLCDTIASEAGLLDLDKETQQNPELFDLLWNGPIQPEHFQLNEPDKRESAIERIKYVNARFGRKFTRQEADAITYSNFC